MMAIRFSFMALLLSSAAIAQTPGIGETRPAPPAPQEQNAPAKDESQPPAPSERSQSASDREIGRCEKLADAQREQCLRDERNAAAGGTRRTEPATAPPPQNPR
jgi:hypothetical protein